MPNAPTARTAPAADSDRFILTYSRGLVLIADVRGLSTCPPASTLKTRDEAWRAAVNEARRYGQTCRLVVFNADGETMDVTASTRWQNDVKAARDADRRRYYAMVGTPTERAFAARRAAR